VVPHRRTFLQRSSLALVMVLGNSHQPVYIWQIRHSWYHHWPITT